MSSSFSVAVRATNTAPAVSYTAGGRSRQSHAVSGGVGSSGSSRRGSGRGGRNGGEGIFRCRGISRGDGGDRLELESHRRDEEASSSCANCSDSFSDALRKSKSGAIGAVTAAVVAGSVVGGVGLDDDAWAAPSLAPIKSEVQKDLEVVRKDARMLERELQMDAELVERDVDNVKRRSKITLEDFIAKEPPAAVFMFALLIINASVGLFWALFFRETTAGPGGEFGKGVVAVRKEVVKGILKFFGSIMGSYVTRQDSGSR